MGALKPLQAKTARYDAMRDAVVIDRRDAEVVIVRSALSDWFGKPVHEAAAVSRALSIEPTIRRAANAVQPDDGTITITSRLLAATREIEDAD